MLVSADCSRRKAAGNECIFAFLHFWALGIRISGTRGLVGYWQEGKREILKTLRLRPKKSCAPRPASLYS